MTTHTKIKKQLAAACGVSRPTLDDYLLDQSFPKQTIHGWPIKDCQEWVMANTKKAALGADKDSPIAELKRLEIYERCRKLALANDIKTGELVAKKRVATANMKVASEMRQFLYQKLCNEIPPESREWGIKTYDEFCRKAQTFGELWD